jgi:hypothetical protein
MMPDAVVVRPKPEERAELEGRLRAPTTEQRQAFRARIVPLATEGRSTRPIARDVSLASFIADSLLLRVQTANLPGFSGNRGPSDSEMF